MHTTGTGSRIHISAMTDDHLMNTISLFCNTMAAMTDALNRDEQLRSRRAKALYGDNRVSDQDYRNAISTFEKKTGPYILEAVVRGLDMKPIREAVVAAVGRSTRDEEAPLAEINGRKKLCGHVPRDLDDEDETIDF